MARGFGYYEQLQFCYVLDLLNRNLLRLHSVRNLVGVFMTDKPNTGGPAFPLTDHSAGMTLRDYFAGQALPAMIGYYNGPSACREPASNAAYKLADAMLAAREFGK